jgi:hypothetical protein
MSSRAEITAKFAKAYVKASKADKGQILDQVVEVTGWSRDNARRLTVDRRGPSSARSGPASRQTATPAAQSEVFLRRLEGAAEGLGGLRRPVRAVPDRFDGRSAGCAGTPGKTVPAQDRYSVQVRAELLAMSSATIDRYLRGAKARDQIKGKSTIKASPLLRSSVKIRKATDDVEASPGFSKVTPSRTAGRPSKVSSPAL